MQEVQAMIREHDAWSKMGEENLGEMNISWAERTGDGGFMLMKAILNDHWADARKGWKSDYQWDRTQIDYVMSKLYWCWVAMLEHGIRERQNAVIAEVVTTESGGDN